MMVVTLLIALMAAITFPSVRSGLETLRLNAAARGMVDLFNSALNRAERRQEAVEVVVSRRDNRVWMLTSLAGSRRDFSLPDSIHIVDVLPPIEDPDDHPRTFFLYPGGTTPGVGVVLKSNEGAIRIVSVDPVTGVPSVTKPEPQE
jgi:type II secretory pathway pseudopilin PulG